jgi:hypothetical protein
MFCGFFLRLFLLYFSKSECVKNGSSLGSAFKNALRVRISSKKSLHNSFHYISVCDWTFFFEDFSSEEVEFEDLRQKGEAIKNIKFAFPSRLPTFTPTCLRSTKKEHAAFHLLCKRNKWVMLLKYRGQVKQNITEIIMKTCRDSSVV